MLQGKFFENLYSFFKTFLIMKQIPLQKRFSFIFFPFAIFILPSGLWIEECDFLKCLNPDCDFSERWIRIQTDISESRIRIAILKSQSETLSDSNAILRMADYTFE